MQAAITRRYFAPGHYSVTVNKAGFKSSTSQGLVPDVDQVLRVNVTLSPGTVAETITVNGQQIALDTDSATVYCVCLRRPDHGYAS